MVGVGELLRAGGDGFVAGGDSQRMVGDGDLCSTLTFDAVDLHIGQRAHLEGQGRRAGVECDRGRGDPHHFADESSQNGRMTSGRSREHRAEGLGLLLRSSIVEVERHPPTSVGHDARGVDRKGDIESFDRQVLELAFVDVPPDDRSALSLGRGAEEDAGARRLAVAGLEIGS